MISFWVQSILTLLLLLFDIRLLPKEQEDMEVFTTDQMQLTATYSRFRTILLEFSSMSFCKI